jgi:chemotaxis protein methyltransferase CheR
MMQGQALSISPRHEELLCNLIYQQFGLVVRDHQLNNLYATIQQACQKFGYNKCGHYLEYLETAPHTSPQWEHLISGVTIGESYFFRDDSQIQFLRHHCLPKLIARHQKSGDKTLRIWSAGCSSGQELYTLAFLIAELLPDPGEWNVHLMGTDINTEVLSQALHGRYSEWSLRATPEAVRSRFFSRQGNEYIVRPLFRSMASFNYLNLIDDDYPAMLSQTHAMDLILCRNVFIYFDKKIIDKVMKKFTSCLLEDGYLLLGSSDLLASAVPGLVMRQVGNVSCFQHLAGSHAETVTATRKQTATAVRKAVTAKRKLPPLTKKRRSPEKPVPVQPAPAKKGVSQASAGIQAVHKKLIGLLSEERWSDALAVADRGLLELGEHSDLLQHKAKALANLGNSTAALKLCEHSLSLDSTEKHTYFIQALVLFELERVADAEAAMRKVIYLDREFVEAHFQLGLIHIRQGQKKSGLKHLHNALDLASRGDPERRLHHAPGMSYARLSEILSNEIEMYEN